jgi:hypothetical protein
MLEYRVGSVIKYSVLGGIIRVLTVTEKKSDIKYGYPGFSGDMADGQIVWGYDNQIIEVISF